MNYVFLTLELFFVFLIMIGFYKISKKDGLYLFIGLMSSILSVIMFKSIDILSFQVNLGLPIIVGLFICSNIIIQRFGYDEVKRIMFTSGIAYVSSVVIVSLLTLVFDSSSGLNLNDAFNSLFGYDIFNVRVFLGGFISIMVMLWCSSYIYYSIRRSKNVLWFSNIGTMLITGMIESIIFVVITYAGGYDFTLIFGMIVIRYLVKIVFGIIGLVPVYTIVKMRDK